MSADPYNLKFSGSLDLRPRVTPRRCSVHPEGGTTMRCEFCEQIALHRQRRGFLSRPSWSRIEVYGIATVIGAMQGTWRDMSPGWGRVLAVAGIFAVGGTLIAILQGWASSRRR